MKGRSKYVSGLVAAAGIVVALLADFTPSPNTQKFQIAIFAAGFAGKTPYGGTKLQIAVSKSHIPSRNAFCYRSSKETKVEVVSFSQRGHACRFSL